jgi:hypothetical protein
MLKQQKNVMKMIEITRESWFSFQHWFLLTLLLVPSLTATPKK